MTNSDLPSYTSLSPPQTPAPPPASPIQSQSPPSPPPESPQSACFFSNKNGRYQKTYPLWAVTGQPVRGYLTMVWEASEQPSPKRLQSWVHLRPPRVRKPSTTSSSLLTTAQENDSSDDSDDNEEENPEFRAAMATLERDRAMHKFNEEKRILREEINESIAYSVLEYEDEYEADDDVKKYFRELKRAKRVEAWVEEVKEARPWGNGARKRSRPEYNENGREVEEPPSPPTKRAKFEFPCVVPSCDRGYKNKAGLQRHVYNGHVEVSDPAARRACRLLWGETFKGGRLEEINRRYGGYPAGV
jgi:hypothetical protein